MFGFAEHLRLIDSSEWMRGGSLAEGLGMWTALEYYRPRFTRNASLRFGTDHNQNRTPFGVIRRFRLATPRLMRGPCAPHRAYYGRPAPYTAPLHSAFRNSHRHSLLQTSLKCRPPRQQMDGRGNAPGPLRRLILKKKSASSRPRTYLPVLRFHFPRLRHSTKCSSVASRATARRFRCFGRSFARTLRPHIARLSQRV
jgi:hypothetical protein